MCHCLWTLASLILYIDSHIDTRLYCDRSSGMDISPRSEIWLIARQRIVFLQLTMVSRKVLLTSRWGYYLQIDEQQNICGSRTKDEYCGKIKKKSSAVYNIHSPRPDVVQFGQPQVIQILLTQMPFFLVSSFWNENGGFQQGYHSRRKDQCIYCDECPREFTHSGK